MVLELHELSICSHLRKRCEQECISNDREETDVRPPETGIGESTSRRLDWLAVLQGRACGGGQRFVQEFCRAQ